MMAEAPLAVIELGSAWMLGWLAAAGIPLALHLLHRRRQQEIKWAAIELLMQAIQQNSRTVRIEGWLLLLLRMLVLILLALALARPLLVGGASVDQALAEPPRLWVIVLDASYSMNYTVGQQSLWQQAQQQASELVSQASPRDAFMLIQMSDPPQAIIGQPVFDAARVTSELRRLKCTDAGARLSSCLELVQQTVEDARQSLTPESRVEIAFFSDMGRDTWQAAVDGDTRATLQQLSTRFVLHYHSLAIEKPANLAIIDFQAESPLVLEGRDLPCWATVHNFGSEPAIHVPVQFLSDGATVQTEFVDCPPGQARTVTAQLQPPAGRNWQVSALLPDDALQPDNRRDLVISVRPQVRVVTVESTSGAARLVNLSLSPLSSSETIRQLKRRSISVETWSLSQLQARKLNDIDAIVLVDVGPLDSANLVKLQEYLESGGAILSLFGPNSKPSRPEQAERSSGTTTPQATTLTDLLGFSLDVPSAPGDYQVDPLGYNSPVAKPFSNYLDAGLLTTPIFRYWKIKEAEPADVPPNVSASVPVLPNRRVVDLALSSGDPWIVRRAVGAGWIAAMLSAPEAGGMLDRGEASWNAMATWPSFVPVMQKLVEVLVGGGDIQHNLLVGQPMRGWLSNRSSATELVIARPDKSQSRITIPAADGNSRPAWVYTQVDRAGLYTMTTSSTSSTDTPADRQLFAANIDPNQSDMQSIRLDSLPVGRPDEGALALAASSADLDIQPNEFLTKTSLYLLLAVLVLESWLAWHLGRRLA